MRYVFLGLTVAECKNLTSFYHFREPLLENNKNALLSIDQSLCFLDSIEFDIPKGMHQKLLYVWHYYSSIGCWTLQFERGSGVVVLHSLVWFGMVSYHVPDTSKYGYFYCGTGERNNDLPFML